MRCELHAVWDTLTISGDGVRCDWLAVWGTLTISGDGVVSWNTTVHHISSRNSEATNQNITSSIISWVIDNQCSSHDNQVFTGDWDGLPIRFRP